MGWAFTWHCSDWNTTLMTGLWNREKSRDYRGKLSIPPSTASVEEELLRWTPFLPLTPLADTWVSWEAGLGKQKCPIPFCTASCSQVKNKVTFHRSKSRLWGEGWVGWRILARALFSWILKKICSIKICCFFLKRNYHLLKIKLSSLIKKIILAFLEFLWSNVDMETLLRISA